MSSFASLNTALSGLIAHRRALDVTGHNIANVDTAGYSRRRANLAATGQSTVPAIWSRSVGNGGVTVTDVTRIRDELLEQQAVVARGGSSRVATEASILARLERTVPEPSDVGLAAQLGDFWASWDDIANNPGGTAGRIAVLQQASTVATSLNRISADQRSIRDSSLQEASALVAEVNMLAVGIAELNAAVARSTAAGLDPHDLADQRDQLVLQLAEVVGVSTRQGELGTVDVLIGGTALVRGGRAESLQVVETGPLGGPFAGTGLDRVEVQWSIDGYPASVTGGRIAGLLSAANEHVPRSIAELDQVAASLVAAVNTLHQGGQGLDPVNDVGLNFWDPGGTTASSIRLSGDVAGQPGRIAAATLGNGVLDAGVAQALAAMSADPNGPSAVYQNMIGRLAVETQAVSRRADIQHQVALRADEQRLAVSGVNLDEELTNLITTQRAYEASARLLSAVDQTLDTLVNRTGIVGR